MRLAVSTPALVLVVGFSFSLAANLLWTWPGGPVRILGGALASVALPAAVHMWPTIAVDGWGSRWVRNLVMTAIAGLAAWTTFEHAAALLIAAGESPWLARGYPVMTELLVVFAVLARRSPAAPVAVPTRKPRPRRVPPPLSPDVAAPTPDEVRTHRGARTDRVAWLLDQPPMSWTDAVEAVEAEYKVSRSTAKRVVAAAGRKAS